jgi:PAS domain S-box-containing protein
MHYTGMLAFHLPVPVLYHVPTVALSLLAAVLACAVALWVASRERMSWSLAARGSAAMGLGIATMHYTGMAAMRLQATARWDAGLVALSVLIAVAVSLVGLWLAFRLRDDNVNDQFWRRLGAAVIMGAAIPSMHYTAMAAVAYQASSELLPTRHVVGIPALGVAAVIGTTVLILAVALVTSVVDRRLSAKELALASSERALRSQQLLLAQVVDANPNLIFVKDWDGRFVLANKAVAEVYGTTPEELLGRTDADFNPNQAEVERFLRDDRAVMTSREPLHIKEEPATNPATGETRWFQTVKVPLVGGQHGVPQVLGVATDITHHRRLEDQLRQAQKMEAVGRLAGGVAHDFNNLLTAIMGHADLLLAECGVNARVYADLAEIKRAAERAAGLTRQLLAFSRKQVLQPRRLDLNSVVANMESLLRRLIGEHIDLRTVAGRDVGSVEADPGQLEQVIMNLALNARDAMPRGGKLTVETAGVELDASFAATHHTVRPGRYVMLAVSDTGVGMDEHVKAHLFEPFFTTKEQGKGTGLGLATVYGIVKQSGGYIFPYSEPNRGATFKIYLPQVAGPSDAALTPEASGAELRGLETVLVVEDEAAVRKLASRVLTSRGYRVIVAADGQEALDTLARFDGGIDLLITDVIMPRVSGRELVDRVLPMRPDIKVLYLSGYTDDAVVRHGVLEEGVQFLQKPFTPDALARRVREVLTVN